MKNTRIWSKILSVLLVLAMLFGAMSVQILARDAEPVYVIAGSDFQYPGDVTINMQTINNIMTKMKNDGVTSPYGFLFAGDYGWSSSSLLNDFLVLKNGIDANTVFEFNQKVFIEGNHDTLNTLGSYLVRTGDNDPENGAGPYGLFVINESSYPTKYQPSSNYKGIARSVDDVKNVTAATAAMLDEYLDAKAEEGYTKPIFVISHLPLHVTQRTYEGMNSVGRSSYNSSSSPETCGRFAKELVDVLNEGGEKGLNIFFLYGHDHAWGFDSVVGGDCVYLAKGETMRYANGGTRTAPVVESSPISFTYVNAGYTGYYQYDTCDNNPSANDGSLTMTLYKITGDKVDIVRYDENGQYALARQPYHTRTPADDDILGYTGLGTVSEDGSDIKYVDSKIGSEGTSVVLNKALERTEFTDDNYPGFSVLARAESVTVNRIDGNNYTGTIPEGYNYTAWDVNADGFEAGTTAKVTLPTGDYDPDNTLVFFDNGSNLERIDAAIADGTAVFNTTRFGTWIIGQRKAAMPVSDGSWASYEIPGETQYVLDTDGVDIGASYLILGGNSSGAKTTYALAYDTLNPGDNPSVRINVTLTENSTIATPALGAKNYLWVFDGTSNAAIHNPARTAYFRCRSSEADQDNFISTNPTATAINAWTVTAANLSTGQYGIRGISNEQGAWDLRHTGTYGKFYLSQEGYTNALFLYKENVISTVTGYARLSGALEQEYVSFEAPTEDEVLDLVKIQLGDDGETAAQELPVNEYVVWDEPFDGTVPGEYTATVSYNGTELGTISVVVNADAQAYSAEVSEPVYVNEYFNVKLTSITPIENFNLRNEIYHKVSSTVLSSGQNEAGRYEITFRLKLGTVGNGRTLTVYDGKQELCQFSFDVLDTPLDSYSAEILDPVYANEDFRVKLTTVSPIRNLALKNENGNKVTSTITNVAQNDDGKYETTLQLKVGTAGNDRRLTVYDGDKELFPFSVNVNKRLDEIVSVEAPASVKANEAFNVTTVVTNALVKGKFTSESGNKIGSTVVSRTQNGNTTTIVYSLSVGTAGQRTLTFNADYDKRIEWPYSQSFDITVEK